MKPRKATLGRVYLAICETTGKKYVGKTINKMEDRKKRHLKEAEDGSMTVFHCALRKYGSNAFRWLILYRSTDCTSLNDVEKNFIKRLKTQVPHGYNLTEGGEGALGLSPSEETRGKLRAALLGHVLSEETRKKISDAHKGKKRVFSKEHRENLSKSLRGLKKSEEHKKKIGELSKGRKHSESTKLKMSKSLKGRTFSEEHRQNISKSLMGKKCPHLKGHPRSEETRSKIRVGVLRYISNVRKGLK